MGGRNGSRPWLGLAVLVMIAFVAHLGRQWMIQDWFRPAASDPPPQLDEPPPPPAGVDRARGLEAPRVRVVLLDGLSLRGARELPTLGQFCGEGIDLLVDVGFPTVSLPVQSVLWTGLTQQQSGLRYVVEQLEFPPPGSLPGEISDSAAVVESHREIADSFGFSVVTSESPEGSPSWRQEGFTSAAEQAVSEDRRLVFVHVLRVDEAGHRSGADSVEYREAAAWADGLLGRLVTAERTRHDLTMWVVLSDHGHRPGGGHGGAEEGIRLVRACIFGGAQSWQAWPSTGRIHLIDLARTLFDVLAVTPPANTVGRPLGFALAHPDPDATLPRPGPWRWLVALVVLGIGIAAAWRAAGRVLWLPWWMIVAWSMVVWVHGPVTLSNPVVYPPLGRDVLVAALPGGFLCLVTAWLARASAGLGRTTIALLVPSVAVVVAATVLSWGGVVPEWSANASVSLLLLAEGAIAIGVAHVLRTVPWRARDRGHPSRAG